MLPRQRSIIRSAKGLGENPSPLVIPILDEETARIGALIPVDRERAADDAVVSSLTRWRQQSMRFFLTQFEASDDRTEAWLNNAVLQDDARILFLIRDEGDRVIGHVGVRDIDERSAQIDNVLRGGKGGDPRLMFHSLVALIRWLYDALGVEDAYLHVFSDNRAAIRLYRSVGFAPGAVYGLAKTEAHGETQYRVDLSSTPKEGERGYLKMSVDKAAFLEKRPPVEGRGVGFWEAFREQSRENIAAMGNDDAVRDLARRFLIETAKYKYSFSFSWLGSPIIQVPQDMAAIQEIIWRVRPDLIVETGIAHGGSLIFSSSMLEILGGDGQVLGVDIDIREHNRAEIEKHPMFKRITMIEGSSVDDAVVKQVRSVAKGKKRVLVFLDSNHTHKHVLRELQLYSPLVKRGGYLVVFDTVVEDMPDELWRDRPWGKGDNPKTAVREFLRTNDRFEIDKEIESKLLITVAPDGYLRCVKD